jgi:ubiquinone/menaquinone biosynthesis C-methylase UbiE
MSTQTSPSPDPYALARTPAEYERLRAQARAWEPAMARLLDGLGLGPGARCLDAGCGPGESMRLLAERVGPSGSVTGIDIDGPLGEQALDMLRGEGHGQCAFARVDLTAGDAIPGGPFDLVYARLLLFHLPERVAVLRRLWDAVAPGGHLLIQDYDVRSSDVLPALDSIDEWRRVVHAAFDARGADPEVGAHLPQLFARAGIGAPDGTDVAGRLESFADGARFFIGVHQGIASAAIAHGITTEDDAAALRTRIARDAERYPDRPVQWPLLVGAWKRKPARVSRG